jgi:2-oxoglutarate dehydrogenase E2 component (dihydrolipoamide succinyltransferase)
MPVNLIVPNIGESITEVQIVQWLVLEGSRVVKDQKLAVMESDKATLELPSPVSGTLSTILVAGGQMAKVGAVIGYLEPSPVEASPVEISPVGASPVKQGPVMPAAVRVLAENGISATDVQATGPGNRLLKEDVQRHIDTKASGERIEKSIPMSMLRKKVAERLVQAHQNSALLTTFNEIDMSVTMELRKRHQDSFVKKYGIKLGIMSFFVKASVEALKSVPEINAEIRENNVIYKQYYDIGIAIGGGKGLVVPLLRNAEKLSFAQVELAIADFGIRARANTLLLEELKGGTFTITNGGVYGSLFSTPIVNPPQSGVLGLHAIQDRPVARDGAVVIRPMMYVALTYDHRIVDGREAVGFLKRIKEILEEPARMLLEI